MLIEDLNKQECGEVLKRLGFGRLSCASNNQPYVVPIYFAYEPNHIFGFSTVGQKIEWMRKNPRVCVEADEVIGQDNWTSVLVFGRYEELPDSPKYAALRLNAHSLLAKRTLWWQPAIASSKTRGELFGPFPVFYCIHIVEVTGHRSSPDQQSEPANPPERGGQGYERTNSSGEN
jgi:nitroimidazol reductase NimA-like FMN-containing flavoprotein (pyridoxamine 5'-phosphate oxidase superfamily)